jgi:hypothetical protein
MRSFIGGLGNARCLQRPWAGVTAAVMMVLQPSALRTRGASSVVGRRLDWRRHPRRDKRRRGETEKQAQAQEVS